MQALVITTPGQDAASVFVNDENLTVDNHVIAILLEQILGTDGVIQESNKWRVDRVIEIIDTYLVFNLVDC